MSTWEQFQIAYQAATPELQAFIDSEQISLFLDDQVSNQGLSSILKTKLVLLVSDFSLNIITNDQLGSALVALGIPFESSHKLYAAIVKFVSPVRNGIKSPTIGSAPGTPLQNEIVETELALEKMHGLRTMAQDVKEAESHKSQTGEMVYQSSQSDLLRPGAGAAGSNTPQWETDN